MMRFGLSAMIVTDPDSKFRKEFAGMCLLQIPHDKSARGNHNAIIAERFFKFLNSGMKIFTSERSTKRVFVEGAETLCYAWNLAPVTGTDLSRSPLFHLSYPNNTFVHMSCTKILITQGLTKNLIVFD